MSNFEYTNCPSCQHRNNKFFINKSTGWGKCWHCGHNKKVDEGCENMNEQKPLDEIPSKEQLFDYTQYLLTSPDKEGLNYLVGKRKLSIEAIKKFKLGYAAARKAIVIPEIRKLFIPFVEYRFLQGPQRYQTTGSKGLFNANVLLQPTKPTEVILVEGALDCVAAYTLSNKYEVLGMPNNQILKKIWLPYFEGIKKIYLALDQDESTEEHIHKFVEFFGAHRCYRVKYPAKDVNDLLCSDAHAPKVWEESIKNAEPYEEQLVKKLDVSVALDTFKKTTIKSISTGIQELDDVSGGIKRGELIVVGGHTGIGKTTFTTYLCTSLAKRGIKSLIGSFEMPFYESIAPKIVSFNSESNALIRSAEDYAEQLRTSPHLSNISFIDRIGQINPLSLVGAISNAYHEDDIRFVVIDHFHHLVEDGEFERQNIDKTVKLLHNIVKKIFPNICILVVVHPPKLPRGEKGERLAVDVYDMKGSSSIAQWADNVWLLNKQEEFLNLKVAKLRSDKTNLVAGGSINLLFNKLNFTYKVY